MVDTNGIDLVIKLDESTIADLAMRTTARVLRDMARSAVTWTDAQLFEFADAIDRDADARAKS